MSDWLTLSNIGSVASMLGVGLSVYVIYNVREIRKSYLFTARAAALLKRLRTRSSNIKELLDEFETSIDKIEAELARCMPVLDSLKRKVTRNERKPISEALRLISANKTLSDGSRQAVWDIFKELLKVEEAVTNLQKDKQWER